MVRTPKQLRTAESQSRLLRCTKNVDGLAVASRRPFDRLSASSGHFESGFILCEKSKRGRGANRKCFFYLCVKGDKVEKCAVAVKRFVRGAASMGWGCDLLQNEMQLNECKIR